MGTLVINTFLTLDGVAQAPGGPDEDRVGDFEHGGWQVPHFTEQLGEIIGPWFAAPGALLLGRRTYDIFAAFWPLVPEDHEDYPMAKILNETPKYVASRTLATAAWQHTTILGGDTPKAVAELKEQVNGEIQVHGSIDLAQTLIAHDLVDEYRLTVFPVVLGTGKRLFGDGTVPRGLKLVDCTTTSNGVTMSTYVRGGELSYGEMGPEFEN
jgi:dihydrofolate reductase